MRSWFYILIIVILVGVCLYLGSQLTEAHRVIDGLNSQVDFLKDQAVQAGQTIERLNRACHH